YVIRSFNEDKPFDQLVREHLAGDVVGKGRPEVEDGTTFLVAGPYDNVNNQDAVQQQEIRANTLDDVIRAATKTFLGLTDNGARCDDHKLDPVPTEDYSRLHAACAGVHHGERVLATTEQRQRHADMLRPLNEEKTRLAKERATLVEAIVRGAEETPALAR